CGILHGRLCPTARSLIPHTWLICGCPAGRGKEGMSACAGKQMRKRVQPSRKTRSMKFILSPLSAAFQTRLQSYDSLCSADSLAVGDKTQNQKPKFASSRSLLFSLGGLFE
ncbi:hypothetical protein AOLI_G00074700, partial [Acnodon oligacanthus]